MNGDWNATWPAPAKLNLFLHVVGRRADGYHLLQTVFRFIDLADTLRFEPRNDGHIMLATPTPGVPDDQNLIVRAARELQKVGVGETALGATLHLEKHIPMGGGLGGGSSDAATTLLALNHLWGLGLSRERLQAIGLTLGADVPVFIHGHSTFAEGIGERFTDVTVPACDYVLTMPEAHVPTLDIFRSPDLKRDTPAIRPADWHVGFGHNDLESVACALYPEVARHLDSLRAFGNARMTGSGACCFVSFSESVAATKAIAALPKGICALKVSGLAKHPLCGLT
ncbi:MAG: 4-(cytidine 5'-diphospho)-2-C-methyl-D-erythritol kinase [Rhodocyclaceae bacterium]|nr:4-(cytidine 5'-diphospho)-2-C-methyl-D-erythritol kinase [Rhodocyclaceae bacterium]MDZ4214471.1 4-(cytidine 5'-diphospho)-2-C-methyl-D-erythritol kinase [Rhodocyclaceae bacterium]